MAFILLTIVKTISKGVIMKKRIVLLALLFVFIVHAGFSTIIKSRFRMAQSEEEFDICYYFVENVMTLIEPPNNTEVDSIQAMKIKMDGIDAELRYSLFLETETDESTFRTDFLTFLLMCFYNIAGFKVDTTTIGFFPQESVHDEFNGDLGATILIIDPVSEYAKGYKYIQADIFYKEGQGIVLRTFLFNDLDFINEKEGKVPSSPLYKLFHSFKFFDKDADGKYIIK